MPKTLTSNQVDNYHRDGLLFPLPALSPTEVEHFRFCHDETDRRLGGQPTAQQKGDCHLRLKWVCDLAIHAAVLDAVEDIIGRDILIHSSTIFTKYAFSILGFFPKPKCIWVLIDYSLRFARTAFNSRAVDSLENQYLD